MFQILQYRPVTSVSHIQYPALVLPTANSVSRFFVASLYDDISVQLINDNFLVMGDPRLYTRDTTGVGAIRGNTYLNEKPNLYESYVILYHNNIEVKRTYTVDGAFEFNHINSNLEYELRAVPLDNEHNPKIIKDVSPFIDNNSYNFMVYALYNDYYANIDSSLQLAIRGNKSKDLIFGLDGDSSGISIDNKGLIRFIFTSAGVRNVTATVTDSDLQLTKSFPLAINVIGTERRYVPMKTDTNDTYNGEVWDISGDTPFYNNMTKFTDGAHISSMTPLKVDTDFYISFKFIKYNLNSLNNFYATVFSAGNTLSDDISYIIIFGAGHIDAGKIVFRINRGDKLISSKTINEYQLYKVAITRVENTVSMYIDDKLDTSVVLTPTMIDEYSAPTFTPIRIGTNVWDNDVKKGGFGGLINDFEYMYNYSMSTLNEDIKYVDSYINYELTYDNGIITTTYGESPINSTVNVVENRLVFTGTESIQFEPNSINRLDYTPINLYVQFECDTIDANMQCLVDNLSPDNSSGFGIFISNEGLHVHTLTDKTSTGVSALTIVPFAIEAATINKLAIVITEGVITFTLNGVSKTLNLYIHTSLTNEMFTIGSSTNIGVPFIGYIDSLRITNEPIVY